jgi:hypothetical protein
MVGLWPELLAPTIAAAAGAGAGAYFAFLSERRNRAKRVEDERVTATNVAIFTLARILVEVAGCRHETIDPQRDKADRWYNLAPILLPAPPTFDTASLSYLFELESDEAKNLPMQVNDELTRYASIVAVTHERNQIQLNEAQPAIERGMRTIENAQQMSLDQVLVYAMGGHRILKTLQGLTDDLIKMIDILCESIPQTANKLRKIAKAQYPDRVIIRFEPAKKETATVK